MGFCVLKSWSRWSKSSSSASTASGAESEAVACTVLRRLDDSAHSSCDPSQYSPRLGPGRSCEPLSAGELLRRGFPEPAARPGALPIVAALAARCTCVGLAWRTAAKSEAGGMPTPSRSCTVSVTCRSPRRACISLTGRTLDDCGRDAEGGSAASPVLPAAPPSPSLSSRSSWLGCCRLAERSLIPSMRSRSSFEFLRSTKCWRMDLRRATRTFSSRSSSALILAARC
mmetsp:Transcript_2032/g.6259  ORF Transcript_2032/g.6259 Transcript_2032/m.6259 type:complete len:228 (-) Transcript_2032:621-1304(-)